MTSISFISALILTLLAGFVNGSFAAPTKYMDNWKEENIWLVFSFFTFLIFPWLTLYLLSPTHILFFQYIPGKVILFAILGGLIFGIGMVFFSLAFKFIGIGINFVINISMGTAGAALIPLLWQKDLILSVYGLLQCVGIMIFVFAVLLSIVAASNRDKNNIKDADKKENTKLSYLFIGVTFSIMAGVGSICQGVSYAYANPVISELATQQGIDNLSASIATWIIVFTAASVPYSLYFVFLCCKKKTLNIIFKSSYFKEYLFLFLIMGFCYWGSIVIFSRASSLIGGKFAPTIAWPLFMVFIILSSNFWGWICGEWKNAGSKAIVKIWFSILLFVLAIIVFSCSASLKP